MKVEFQMSERRWRVVMVGDATRPAVWELAIRSLFVWPSRSSILKLWRKIFELNLHPSSVQFSAVVVDLVISFSVPLIGSGGGESDAIPKWDLAQEKKLHQ